MTHPIETPQARVRISRIRFKDPKMAHLTLLPVGRHPSVTEERLYETLVSILDNIQENRIAGFTVGWIVRRPEDGLLEAHHSSTMGDDEHMLMLLGILRRMDKAINEQLDLIREDITFSPAS